MHDVIDKAPSGSGAADRRRYERVQDAVGLQVERLVELPAAGHIEAPHSAPAVRKTDKYSIEGYAEVRRDFPAVTQYITDLEERIRELLLDGDSAPSRPSHKVSLSAGGLHFSHKTLFVPDEIVSVTLTLFPSGRRIGTDAVIVSANDSDEVLNKDNLTYRAEFVRISDVDRLVIAAHVERLLTGRTKLQD